MAGAGGLCARITNAYNWPIPLIVRFRTMVARHPPRDRLPNRAFNAPRLARDLPLQSTLFTMNPTTGQAAWSDHISGRCGRSVSERLTAYSFFMSLFCSLVRLFAARGYDESLRGCSPADPFAFDVHASAA